VTFEVHHEKEDALVQVFRVEAPEDWIQDEERRVGAALGKVVRVNGFRKGKVPGKIVQRVFPDRVRAMVAESIMEKVGRDELKALDFLVVGEAMPIEYSREDGKGVTLRFTAPALKREALPDWSEWTLERYIYPISESNVEETVQMLQQQHASLEEKEEGALEQGDVCLADLQLMQGGTALVGYKSDEPVGLEIGRDALGEGSDAQLLGAAKGEVRRVVVTQDQAPNRERGSAPRKREYEATVKQIYRKVLPELNETFFAQVSRGRAKDEESFKGFIRNYLESELQTRQRRELQSQIRDQLYEKSPWTPPQDMVERQAEQLKRTMAETEAENAAPDREERIRGVALKQVKIHFLMEALASDMDLAVSEEELNRALNASNVRQEDRDDKETRDAIEAALLNEKVYSRILSETKIKDVPMKSMESVLA